MILAGCLYFHNTGVEIIVALLWASVFVFQLIHHLVEVHTMGLHKTQIFPVLPLPTFTKVVRTMVLLSIQPLVLLLRSLKVDLTMDFQSVLFHVLLPSTVVGLSVVQQ